MSASASDGLTFVYSSSDRPPIETGQVDIVSGKEYRFVQNGATTATAGYPAIYVAATPDSGDYDITADLSEGLAEGCFAGMVMAELGPYEYGWLMKDGLYHTCTLGAAVTLGDAVCISTVDGAFVAATDTSLLAICGVAFEAATQAATGVSVFVKGL